MNYNSSVLIITMKTNLQKYGTSQTGVPSASIAHGQRAASFRPK